MSRSNKNAARNSLNPDIEDQTSDLFTLTDSEDSSSDSNNQIFEHHQPFVLELHELQRDELPDNPLPEVKTRKLLKKKRTKQPGQEQSAASVSSSSESSIVPPGPGELSKEEFYDAHESYHDFPENRSTVATIGNLGIAASQQDTNPKVTAIAPEATAPIDATTATPAQDAAPAPPTTAISVRVNKITEFPMVTLRAPKATVPSSAATATSARDTPTEPAPPSPSTAITEPWATQATIPSNASTTATTDDVRNTAQLLPATSATQKPTQPPNPE